MVEPTKPPKKPSGNPAKTEEITPSLSLHQEFDEFLVLFREYMLKCVSSGNREVDWITDEPAFIRAVSGFTTDFANQFRRWASQSNSWEELVGLSNIEVEDCIASTQTAVGQESLKKFLASQPYPHFEPHAGDPATFTRVDEDGTRTVGQFVGREFIPTS